jgi:hypothetical protein
MCNLAIKEDWRVSIIDGYIISSIGRLYSIKSNRIRKHFVNKGYCELAINKKLYRMHIVVAKAFIPNTLNKPTVNHKNGIKHDNRVENLEWFTNPEQQFHSRDVLGNKQPRSYDNILSVEVHQYSSDGSYINSFGSACEAQRVTGARQASIRFCCMGKYKHAGGYVWSFEKTEKKSVGEIRARKMCKGIASKDGISIPFSSAREASEIVGVCAEVIRYIFLGKRKNRTGYLLSFVN